MVSERRNSSFYDYLARADLETVARMKKRLDHNHDLRAASDPSDYRRGTLLGSMLVVLGGLWALLGVFAALDGGHTARSSQIYWILGAVMITGLFAGSGVLLVRKAKLGLWGLYLLSVTVVFAYLSTVVSAIATKRVDGPQSAIVGGTLLLVWFSISGYFFKRRRQFTGFWRS